MLNTDGTVKLADFSVAIFMDFNKVGGNKAIFESSIIPGLQSEGTPAYQAPDSQNMTGYDIITFPHAMKADIWSMGIVLYVMTIGRFPFKGTNMVHLFENIAKGKYEIPDWVESNLRNLLTNTININPENRYSIEEIKRHPWMKMKIPKETPIPILPVDTVFGDDKTTIMSTIGKYHSSMSTTEHSDSECISDLSSNEHSDEESFSSTSSNDTKSRTNHPRHKCIIM